MKNCIDCKIEKPLSEYHKNNCYKDGHLSRCKPCRGIKRGHKPRIIPFKDEQGKQCTNCLVYKEFDDFHSDWREAYEYRSQCKLCCNAASKVRHHENPIQQKARSRRYRLAHKDVICKNAAKRRAIKLKATPIWLTKDDHEYIAELYKIAQELTEQTGVPHEVDHIHPLKGKSVCGLHCPDNLQVIPRAENRSKSNKFTP